MHSGRCYSYEITDAATGQSLGEIPLSFRDDEPDNYTQEELAQLSQRLGHMLQTDRAQLASLAQGRSLLMQDSFALEVETGFSIQSLFGQLELSGSGVQVGLSGPECMESGSLQSPNDIAGSEVTIGHIEYRPDVQNYTSFYEQGQLRSSLAGNAEAIAALEGRMKSNLDNVLAFVEANAGDDSGDGLTQPGRPHSCAFDESSFTRNFTNPMAGLRAIIDSGQQGSGGLVPDATGTGSDET